MPTDMTMPMSAGTPSGVPVTNSSPQNKRLDQATERRRHDEEHDRDAPWT